MLNPKIQQNREFLKDSIRKTINFALTDQSKGIHPPPIEKPFDMDAERIDLISPDNFDTINSIDVISAIKNRRSRRRYSSTALTIEEISFLLWATQGVRKQVDISTAYRTVPSAGARHAFETYLFIQNIQGISEGFYRYLPLEHQLIFEFYEEQGAQKIIRATFNQTFIGKAPVIFIWTAIPYRIEWRYGRAAHKVILLDAGHVCQNLYIACEAIGAGTCAIAAYDQELIDELLRLDGEDEFVIYLAPVGK